MFLSFSGPVDHPNRFITQAGLPHSCDIARAPSWIHSSIRRAPWERPVCWVSLRRIFSSDKDVDALLKLVSLADHVATLTLRLGILGKPVFQVLRGDLAEHPIFQPTIGTDYKEMVHLLGDCVKDPLASHADVGEQRDLQ